MSGSRSARRGVATCARCGRSRPRNFDDGRRQGWSASLGRFAASPRPVDHPRRPRRGQRRGQQANVGMEWCESDELHGTLLALAHSCCSCQTHATHAPPRQQPSVASAATATLAWGRPRGRRRPASSCKGAAQVQRRRLHVPTSPTQDAACTLTSMPPDSLHRLACYASRTPIRRRPRRRPQAQQQPTSITAPADWHQRVRHLAPYIYPGGQGTALSLAATIGFAVRPSSDGRVPAGNEGVVGSELAARAQSVVAVRSFVAHARPVASTRPAAQLAVRLLAPLAQ